ncbi:MAG: FAD-dependent monooxygenase [Candidatus Tectomicrobia bacterium]|nr:FAD-dependent monooxygenase [Candidatus Tectomicrobia bacterium]
MEHAANASTEHHEVIIIGAGPAGAATAKSLRDAGIEPLLIEKKKVPRYKCCGGVLFGEAQLVVREHFGEIPPQVYCDPPTIAAEDIVAYRDDGSYVPWSFELPRPGLELPTTYLNLWREKFDAWLVERSGARLLDGCGFAGFLRKADPITISCRLLDGAHRRFACAYLVGADGGASAVRSHLDAAYRALAEKGMGHYQAFHLHDAGGLDRHRWYVFPRRGGVLFKDDLAVITAVGRKGTKLREHFEEFVRYLGKRFGVRLTGFHRDEGFFQNSMAATGAFVLGHGNILLVGEAAGFLYFHAEGIASALTSGLAAGRAIARARREGRAVLPIYAELVQAEMEHTRLCWNREVMRSHGG